MRLFPTFTPRQTRGRPSAEVWRPAQIHIVTGDTGVRLHSRLPPRASARLRPADLNPGGRRLH